MSAVPLEELNLTSNSVDEIEKRMKELMKEVEISNLMHISHTI